MNRVLSAQINAQAHRTRTSYLKWFDSFGILIEQMNIAKLTLVEICILNSKRNINRLAQFNCNDQSHFI